MKQCVFICIWMLVFPAVVWCASAPMVEKHIFLPEKPVEQVEAVSGDALKAGLEFTGVLISDKGRFAFIKEKKPPKRGDVKNIYQEGDTIFGAVITTITPNHLVLNNKGDDVQLKLYRGNKKRPAPVKVAAPPQVTPAPAIDSTKAGQAQQAAATREKTAEDGKTVTKNAPPTLDDKIREKHEKSGSTVPLESSNPFAQALKKAIEKKQNSPTKPAPNPFLEAIKRAQGKQ